MTVLLRSRVFTPGAQARQARDNAPFDESQRTANAPLAKTETLAERISAAGGAMADGQTEACETTKPSGRKGMRTRITALCVLAAAVAIVLFGVPLAAGAAHYYFTDEQGELERVAAEATIAVSADLLRGRDTSELPESEPEMAVGIYNPAGKLISGKGPATADGPVQEALQARVITGDSHGDLVAAVPVTDEEKVTAVVRAAVPRGNVYSKIASTWGLMLAIALAALGITWILARRLAGRLATPVEDLAGATRRLGDGDFTITTPATGIGEVDAAGASLSATARRLGEVLERERAFSANASHQLRTPLTGLKLILDAALQDEASQRPALEAAAAAADRLDTTITDLLALARDLPRSGEPLNIRALLDELERHWHGALAAQTRPLRVTTASLPETAASEAAVRQILAVLIDNALQHGVGTVSLRAREATGALAIDVADQGDVTGQDTDVMFRRTGGPDGHGIGLAMARALAEAEGGRLTLSSQAPTTFTLLLPPTTP
ncbi:HAMP domain-containing histidine kinase [Actinomadura barringtoniae]|uniref:histidine kinase n=1 Tax=Actinomadura barringtoniae TaxID=1427535 RepID=A0A939PIA1_9ACTN|nr:HAMP domain-containing sensor histidine kinase [Actinomadura barringtoniae]MBO2453221.1 HAMP domain-containing histidine kinase [Actinomadura barringtoniae]